MMMITRAAVETDYIKIENNHLSLSYSEVHYS